MRSKEWVFGQVGQTVGANGMSDVLHTHTLCDSSGQAEQSGYTNVATPAAPLTIKQLHSVRKQLQRNHCSSGPVIYVGQGDHGYVPS